MNKHCPSCNLVKPIDQFSKDKQKPDGHNCYCRICTSRREREQYQKPEVKERKRALRLSYAQNPQPVKEKYCPSCNEVKPPEQFHRDKGKKDGLAWRCKDCQSIYNKSPQFKAIQKRYFQSEKGKQAIHKSNMSEKQRARVKRYYSTEKGKQTARNSVNTARRRYPHKQKARDVVRVAVDNGTLPRPTSLECSHNGPRCRGQAEQYHHYLGYDSEHWLDVQAVCRPCHTELK